MNGCAVRSALDPGCVPLTTSSSMWWIGERGMKSRGKVRVKSSRLLFSLSLSGVDSQGNILSSRLACVCACEDRRGKKYLLAKIYIEAFPQAREESAAFSSFRLTLGERKLGEKRRIRKSDRAFVARVKKGR